MTRGEVTIRHDGRVLDAGGTAIGRVRCWASRVLARGPLNTPRWTAVDDRWGISSEHDTPHEAAIAVHDRVRCSTREDAERVHERRAALMRGVG